MIATVIYKGRLVYASGNRALARDMDLEDTGWVVNDEIDDVEIIVAIMKYYIQ